MVHHIDGAEDLVDLREVVPAHGDALRLTLIDVYWLAIDI